jgi:MFS family permease
VRFSDRFGKGLRQAPRDALIAESTQHAHLGFAYGFHKMMDTLGATIGPLLAMILLPVLNQNIRSLFLLSFVASAFALVTLILFVKEKSDSQHSTALPKLSLKNLPRSYKIFLLAIAVFALGNFSDSFLFLRAQDVGISAVLIPLLYALSNLFFATFATPFGKLADRIGAPKIIIGGYGVFALTHSGFALFASQNTMWILFPLFGIFSAMTESVQKIIAVQTSDPSLKGTMLGLMHTTIGICQLPASLAAGILWDRFGVQAPFFFGSSMAIIAMLLLCVAFWSSKNQTAILPQTR